VGAANARHRVQPPEVVEELVTFPIFALKFPERVDVSSPSMRRPVTVKVVLFLPKGSFCL
jgi:hypothetical protein